MQALKDEINSRAKIQQYVPVKNDEIDFYMSEYINSLSKSLKIPFIRESSGIYMFGFKRVFVKIENGVLVIRVGGGYMMIDEFLELYTQVELEKMLYMNVKNKRPSAIPMTT